MIRIRREPERFGWLLPLVVKLDGEEVARIANGATLEIDGFGGEQRLRFHQDLLASKPLILSDPKNGVVLVETSMPHGFRGFMRAYVRPRSAIACRIISGGSEP